MCIYVRIVFKCFPIFLVYCVLDFPKVAKYRLAFWMQQVHFFHSFQIVFCRCCIKSQNMTLWGIDSDEEFLWARKILESTCPRFAPRTFKTTTLMFSISKQRGFPNYNLDSWNLLAVSSCRRRSSCLLGHHLAILIISIYWPFYSSRISKYCYSWRMNWL